MAAAASYSTINTVQPQSSMWATAKDRLSCCSPVVKAGSANHASTPGSIQHSSASAGRKASRSTSHPTSERCCTHSGDKSQLGNGLGSSDEFYNAARTGRRPVVLLGTAALLQTWVGSTPPASKAALASVQVRLLLPRPTAVSVHCFMHTTGHTGHLGRPGRELPASSPRVPTARSMGHRDHLIADRSCPE